MASAPVHHEDAPAKINLTLAITGRREDGYHLLDSAVVFAAVGDRISLRPGDADQLKVTGAFAESIRLAPRRENSVWQSLLAFRARTGWTQPFSIRLEKSLPVAAGIGGGSSDAAAMLRLLNRLAPQPLHPEALAELALELGADVPVCLKADQGGLWRMRGIGEKIEPLPAPAGMGVVLVNDGIAVSTKEVFGALTISRQTMAMPGPLSSHDPAPYPGPQNMDALHAWISDGNDLLAPALRIAPGISRSLDALTALQPWPGFIAAGMSGSGATCFAVFTHEGAAVTALAAIEGRPGWCWAGGVLGISR